jgi:hypothetical protein
VSAWWQAVSCVSVLQSLSTTITFAVYTTGCASASGELLCDPGSTFVGCLPNASYSAADRLPFLAFLKESGFLVAAVNCHDVRIAADSRCDGGAADFGAACLTVSVLTPDEVIRLRHDIRCPSSLTNEVVVAHQIWERLAATTTQP